MTKDASDTLRVTPLPFMVPRSNICLFPRTPTSSYGTLDPTIARTCGSSREERHRLQERNIVWRKLGGRGAQFLLNQTTCTDELSGGARIADATPLAQSAVFRKGDDPRMRLSVRQPDVCPGEEKRILRKDAVWVQTLTERRTLTQPSH